MYTAQPQALQLVSGLLSELLPLTVRFDDQICILKDVTIP